MYSYKMISAKPKLEVDLDITWIYQSILSILRQKSCDTLFQIPMMVATYMCAFALFYQILITQLNRVILTPNSLVSYYTNPLSINECTTVLSTLHAVYPEFFMACKFYGFRG